MTGAETLVPVKGRQYAPDSEHWIKASALAPCEGDALLLRTMDHCQRIRLRLVDIENNCRQAIWQILPPVKKSEHLLHLQQQWTSIHRHLNSLRARNRGQNEFRRLDTLAQNVDSEYARAKELYERECAGWYEQFRKLGDQIDALQQRRDHDVDGVLKESSLPVEVCAACTARLEMLRDGSIHAGLMLQAEEWHGLSMTFEPPVVHASTREPDAAMCIEPSPGETTDSALSSDKPFRYLVHLRLSNALAEAPWVVFPVYIECRIPRGVRIQHVTIERQQSNDNFLYTLKLGVWLPPHDGPAQHFAVSILDHAPDWHPVPGDGGTVFYGRKVLRSGEHSDKKYRGLCVARWEGSDGRYGFLVLPRDIYSDVMRIQKLKQAEEQNFARMRLILKTWFRHRKRLPNRLIARYLLRIEEWKSVSSLKRLYKAWEKRRFPGDVEMFAIIENWAADHELRAATIRSMKFRVANHRAEAYNHFADRLAQQYRHLVIEKAAPQSGQELNDAARTRASRTGYLRKVLRTTTRFYGSICREEICREEDPVALVSEPVSAPDIARLETA